MVQKGEYQPIYEGYMENIEYSSIDFDTVIREER